MANSYQNGWDKIYCYPESNILKNKLNIRNAEELHNTERYVTKMRSYELMKSPVKGNFDFKHLQKIHKEIFKDIYDWAGKNRIVNIAKGELFCLPEWIPDMAGDIFKKLEKEKFLIDIPKDQIYEKLAYYTGEINALHPFREGNGRTQREFIRELGIVAGHEINFKGISSDEMIKASIDSFNKDYKGLENIYKKITKPYSLKEHFKVVDNVIIKDSTTGKLIKDYFNQIEEIQDMMKKSHFKPTDQVVKRVYQLDNRLNQHLSLKDLKELYKQKESLVKEEKNIVCNIVEELKKQEVKRNKIIELEK